MRILIRVLTCLLVASAACADEGGAVGKTGQFTYRVSQMDVAWKPGSRNTYMEATIGLEITNTGSSPVRIAVVPNWPSAQLEGAAVHFALQSGGLTGIPYFNSNQPQYCAQNAENFLVVRPGITIGANLVLDAYAPGQEVALVKRARFSANMMVQSLEDKKCWIEPFSVQGVAVAGHF